MIVLFGDAFCEASVGWKNEASSLKVGDGDKSFSAGVKSFVGVCVTAHKCRWFNDSVRAVVVCVEDLPVEELPFGIGRAVGDTNVVMPSPKISCMSW